MTSLFKSRSEQPRIDIALDQVPVLINPNPRPEEPHLLKGHINVHGPSSLAGKSVVVAFVAERSRYKPAEGLFSGDEPKNALSKTINANTQLRIPDSSTTPWSLPFEFEIQPGLPGTLEPLKTGSTSVRHFVTARLDFGRLFGSTTAEKDVYIYRACRSDLEGIDCLIDCQGQLDDYVKYTLWSMKSVLCGGRARFEVYLQKLVPDITINSIEIVLKERQVTRIPVPAFHQSRPGEHTVSKSLFELCSKLIDFPRPEGEPQPTAAVFDLQLPQDPKFYRRSTTKRVGVEFEHFFATTITVIGKDFEQHRICFDSNTILSLPLDIGQSENSSGVQLPSTDPDGLLPPSYSGQAAPPGYSFHGLDPVYCDDKTLTKSKVTGDDVLFLSPQTANQPTVSLEKSC